jgi:hypothetical protein
MHYDELPHPPVRGLDAREREFLAFELTEIGRAARERADLLRAGGPGVELAVVELRELASRVFARARRYQHPEGGRS